MRKYIHIAKCLKPKLSEQACEVIANEYSRLRSQDLIDSDVARTQPVTPRTLETLIRLSTAHAKARLANTVNVADANAAIELVQYAYFKKVLEKEKKKRRRSDGYSEDEDDDDDVGENGVAGSNGATTTTAEVTTAGDSEQSTETVTRRTKRTRLAPSEDQIDSDSEPFDTPVDSGDLTRRSTRSAPSSSTPMDTTPQSSEDPAAVAELIQISNDRLTAFRQLVYHAFRECRDQTIPVQRLSEYVNQDSSTGTEPFAAGEITSALARMTDDNQIMVADGIVFLI